MNTSNSSDGATSSAVGLSAPARRIHPLLATAAVAVTAVCAIAAVQFLSPQNARSSVQPGTAAAGSPSAAISAPAAPPGASSAPAAPPGASSAPVPACADCGEIVNIRTTRQEGSGTGLGAVAGGLLGGVLGHQLGAGRGKEAMTVVGAVGGAVAGNQVEKQAKAQTLYHVDVRMADGSARTVTQSTPPNLAIGSKVRVSGNTIVAR